MSGEQLLVSWGLGAAVVAGILKCLAIMRREKTSKVCVMSLLLVLLVWFASIAAQAGAEKLPAPPGLRTLAVVIACGLGLIAALILGIVGLATFDRQRFIQGRAQAIWAIILSGSMLLLFLGGFVIGYMRSTRLNEDSSSGSAVADLEPIEKPEFNFAIDPPAGWFALKPEAVSKLACVGLRLRGKEMYAIVLAERLGEAIELMSLKEICRAHLSASAKVLKQTEEDLTLGELKFGHLSTLARLDAQQRNVAYEHWLATHQGYSWQIICWSSPEEVAALKRESRKLAESFRILDPAKRGVVTTPLEDADRSDLGFRTRLDGLGWQAWRDQSKLDTAIVFGAERTREALVVLALRFPDDSPDLHAVSRALLHALEFEPPSKSTYPTQPWNPGHGGEGIEFSAQREVNGQQFQYVLRVARGPQCAHLVGGWAKVGSGDLELVRKSLDRITLAAPVGAAPDLTAEQKTVRGSVLNEIGLSYFLRKDHSTAAYWFRQAFEQSKRDAVILQNLGNALERARRFQEGREALEPYLGVFSQNFDVGVLHARLVASAGDTQAGNATFLRLIQDGLKDEDDLNAWITLLVDLKDHASARKAADAWVEKQPSANSRRWRARAIFDSGDRKEALGLLEKLRTEYPEDWNVGHELGELSNRAGEHARAGAIAGELLAKDANSVRALAMLGWSQMGRKWYREAKSTFERAAAAHQDDDDDDTADAIRQASAALGEGSNSDIKQPIKPVALPAEVIAALPPGSPVGFGEGHAAIWRLRAIGYRFEKQKPLRKTYHQRVTVLTSEGVNQFASVETTFDPLGERVYLNRIEVKDREGKLVSRGSIDDAYVRDLEGDLATHRKVLHAQAPGLEPGYTLEYEITFEDLLPTPSFPFARHLVAEVLPTEARVVFVEGDVDSVRSDLQQGGGVKIIKSTGLHAWIATAIAPDPNEPLALWAEERCPMLWLAGNDDGADAWQRVAREYLAQLEDRSRTEKDTRELAERITAELRSDREKISVIARSVQRQISYRAIEFGVRARRPNAADETLKSRIGDCKDHALLLQQMLQAAGISSALALINTGWAIHPGFPSLDQFNHMVVHVPSLGEAWFVDATDKHLQLEAFPAEAFLSSHALVLDPKNPRIVPLQLMLPSGSCDVQSDRTVEPEGTDWKVDETFTLSGYYASWMRAVFAGLTPDAQSQKAQQLMDDHGPVQVRSFHFDGIEDLSQPARLRIEYIVRNAVTTSESKGTATMPAIWERDYLAQRFMKERMTPFRWIYPFRFTSNVSIKRAVTNAGGFAQGEEGEFCAWKLEVQPGESDPSEYQARFRFEAKPGKHPAHRYAEFQEAWGAARRAWDRPLEWRVAEPK